MLRVAVNLVTAFAFLALAGDLFAGGADDAAREPAEIEFEGIESFDIESVRRALATDVPMQAASHPRVPIAEYLRTLRHRLGEGYQYAGYLNVKLSVRQDEATGQIKARIREGKPYRCGTIEVTGVEADEALAIQAALEEPFPPVDAVPVTITAADGTEHTVWETSQGQPARLRAPVWPRGGQARAGTAAWSEVWRRIYRHLRASGRYKPDFTIDVVPNHDEGTATLVVKIKDLGPVSMVAGIVIEGARRNSPEDVKEFLGLRQGVEVSERQLALWEHRLWSSGRFGGAYVRARELEAAPHEGPRQDIHVSLHEHPDVPLLREPLSPESTLILKARDWLARLCEVRPDEDVTIDVEWSPQGSFLTRWFQNRLDLRASLFSGSSRGEIVSWSIARNGMPPTFSETLILRDPRITFFAPERSTRFEFDRPEIGNVRLQLRTYACDQDKVKAGESPFGCSFEFQAGTSSDSAAQYLETRISIDPVVALAWPRRQGCTATRRAGRLFLVSKTVHAEIEEQTGRMIDLRIEDKKHAFSLHLRTAAGAVAAELQRQEELLSTSLNAFDAEHPLHAASLFLAGEFSRFAEREMSASKHKQAAALRKLLALWSPEPIGEAVRLLLFAPGPREFLIPRNDDGQRRAGLTFLVLALKDYLVPAYDAGAPSSPSWSLGRDALLTAVAHRTGLIDPQFAQANCGPVAHLAAAFALREIDPPQAALLARSGLEHLSAAEFRYEYAPLLAQDTWLGRSFLSLASALRQLEPHEIRALLRFLPKQFPRYPIANSLLQLNTDPQRPLSAAVAAALDQLWDRTLRAEVAARLNEIIAKARDAAPGRAQKSPIQQVSGRRP